MAGRFTDQTLEEITNRIDIVDLIGSRIKLMRAGPDFKACCPFHKEKTPSFFVSPSRRTFHCFGCGVHGSIFKFLQLSDGLTFRDAVQTLARQCGVQLDETVDYEAAAKGVLFRLHSELAAFYTRCLDMMDEAEPARKYLRSRELDEETARKFGIGYAPSKRGILETWAKKHGYSVENLIDAGLMLPPRENGGDYYDRFRGRLMFPIRNTTGQTVGFSGRTLEQNPQSRKYVNTPETAIFHKGSLLYALDFARKNIVSEKRRQALVCEGQIDVIRCHACGFGTAVASQGTAFTEDHVRLLKQSADSVLLVFDGDGAGLKAAVRTGRLFLQEGIPVSIATLPEGEDPDSFLRTKGPEEFQKILDAPESLIAFQFRYMRGQEANPDSIEAVSRITKEIVETLSICSKAVIRSVMAQEAASLLGVPLDSVESDLAEALTKKANAELWKTRNQPARPPAREQNTARGTGASAPPQPRAAAPRRTPSPGPAQISPAEEVIEIFLQNRESSEIKELISSTVKAEILGESPAAEIISALTSDWAEGTAHFDELCANGSKEVKSLIEKLSRSKSKFREGDTQAPVTAVQDLITKIWADYFTRLRATFGFSDSTSIKRRSELGTTVKKLSNTGDWAERVSIINDEIERILAT